VLLQVNPGIRKLAYDGKSEAQKTYVSGEIGASQSEGSKSGCGTAGQKIQ
jgi:hypothetical protein